MQVKSLVATIAAALAALAVPAPAAVAAPEPELPEPTYQSVSEEVLVEMDDGVKIATTVALPSLDGETAAPGRFPVVLGMTPYGRNGVCGCYPPDFFATRGMVGAVADVRGTGGSGGDLSENFFSPREARDGYNLVEYFGTQPYSTGKVGMAGGSYVGITQYLTAAERPPHLAAIAPQVAISDLYRDGFAHGGIPNLFFDLQYIAVQGAPGTAGTNTDPDLLEETLAAKLGQSPPGSIAFDYLSRPNDDPFYRDRSPIYKADRIEVPALIVGGWHDGLLRGAPEMYQRLAQRPGVETRLHMEPCTHKGCGAPFAPMTDPEGLYDLSALTFEFMQRHLLGTGTPDRPPVEYFLQSADRYVAADAWPPPDRAFETYELRPGELGAPGEPPPEGAAATQSYVSDPAAGFSMTFNKYGTVAATPYVPTDQRLEGPHGLTFRTGALEGPLDLTGPIALHLVAASSATDTDWHAKLADVAPDGGESIITEGSLRASHRALDPAKSTPARPYHPHTDPEPLEPNRFYEFEIEIWPTAYELAKGHRLQLRLTSSDLPTHLPGTFSLDRNDPAGASIELFPPATNTVRMKESHLILPWAGGGARPGGASGGDACAPTKARHARFARRGVEKVLRVKLTRDGRPAAGERVRVRGPGFRDRARTDSRGKARFEVRARRRGRATISARACDGKLRVARRLKRPGR